MSGIPNIGLKEQATLLTVKEPEKMEALLRTCHRSLNSCGRVRVTPAACGYVGRETSVSSRGYLTDSQNFARLLTVFCKIAFCQRPKFQFRQIFLVNHYLFSILRIVSGLFLGVVNWRLPRETCTNEDINRSSRNCPFLRKFRGQPHLQAPLSPPPWLDPRLYAEGLAFFQHNILGVVASNGEALVMGLSIPSFYRAVPLAVSRVGYSVGLEIFRWQCYLRLCAEHHGYHRCGFFANSDQDKNVVVDFSRLLLMVISFQAKTFWQRRKCPSICLVFKLDCYFKKIRIKLA